MPIAKELIINNTINIKFALVPFLRFLGGNLIIQRPNMINFIKADETSVKANEIRFVRTAWTWSRFVPRIVQQPKIWM